MKISDAKIREVSPALKKSVDTSVRTSIFTDRHRAEITYLSVQQLIPYRNQSRTVFNQEEIDSLAETIKEHGIRQPLTVLRVDSDPVVFEVISGERRLRAAKQLLLEKVPCIIITDEEKAEEIALIENIQRQDLHPIELARGLKKLLDKIGYGAQTELKVKVGMTRSQLSELVKLTTLPESVQDLILVSGCKGRENFRRLFQIDSEADQLKYVESLISSRDVTRSKETTAINKRRAKSLIRFTLVNEGITVQRKGILTLGQEQKKELKKILSELILELDTE